MEPILQEVFKFCSLTTTTTSCIIIIIIFRSRILIYNIVIYMHTKNCVSLSIS